VVSEGRLGNRSIDVFDKARSEVLILDSKHTTMSFQERTLGTGSLLTPPLSCHIFPQ
jgi:hypothetical protein